MVKRTIFNLFFFTSTLFLNAQKLDLVGVPGVKDVVDVIEINPEKPSVIYTMSSNTIWKSEDGGNITKPIYLKYLDGINRGLIVPKDKIIIYGNFYYGYIISKDDGLNWEILKEDTSPYLKLIRVNPQNSNIYYIKIKSNELWRSNNEGISWYKVSRLPNEILNFAIHPQDTSIMYLITYDKLYKSTDSGVKWNEIYTAPSGIMDLDLNPLDTNKIFLQKSDGLYRSNNGGFDFKQIFPVLIRTFKLNPVDTNVVYLSNEFKYNNEIGGLYKSTDGGKTWQNKMEKINKIIDPFNKLVNPPRILKITLSKSNSDELYIGDFLSKGILKSTDGGENWSLTNAIFSNPINLVLDKNNPNFIVAGHLGWKIIKTNNAGKNWFEPVFDQDPKKIEGIERSFNFNPINKVEGYLASENGLYKTADGGDHWFRLDDFNLPTYAVYYHKYYPDTLFVNAYYSNFASYDHGVTWEKYETGFPSLYMKFVKSNPTLVYEIHNFNRVYKSNDLGKTWHDKTEGLLIKPETGKFEEISSLEPDINNPNIVYCGQTRGISITIDGGDNWFRIDSSLIELEPYMQQPKILLEEDNNERIYVGVLGYTNFITNEKTQGGLYLSEDGWKTWRKVYNGDIYGIFTDEGSIRYIYINTNHGLMRFLDTLTVTDIAKVKFLTTPKFELFQNYPNPFNPTTTIQYSLKESGIVKLNVFNILGEEIKILVNKFQEKGNYSVKFDASKLSSGIYYYRISVNDFVSVKKMILTK